MASSISPVLYVGLRILLLVIRPMAAGVGVLGGGFVGVLATLRLLFGVVSGGGMELLSSLESSLLSPFDILEVLFFGFRPRFLGAKLVSATSSIEGPESTDGCAWTRADRLSDILELLPLVVMLKVVRIGTQVG